MTDETLYRRTRELTQLPGARAQRLERHGRATEAGPAQVVEEALASYASMLEELSQLHIECRRLRKEADGQTAAWEHLFDLLPVACVVTDSHGEILNANPAAGQLLNVTGKRLRGRQLLLFTEDREALRALLPAGHRRWTARAPLVIRPREHKAVATTAIVAVESPTSGARLWFLTRNVPSQARAWKPSEKLDRHERLRSSQAERAQAFGSFDFRVEGAVFEVSRSAREGRR